jgi:hypothetical protein
MNNHDSHEISEFVLLANKHHIRFFLFVFYFTHCMQILYVNIFHFYKKHHDNTIRKTLSKFYLFYTLKQFCNDLDDIRENTFKESSFDSRLCQGLPDYDWIGIRLRCYSDGTLT